MQPIIRNFRNIQAPGSPTARLIGLDDKPPTCTMTYSEIDPNQTSSHHIHSWEHEIYIIKGSGTLVCDGKDYPVKAGGGRLIGSSDGASNYSMLYTELAGGQSSHQDSGGHIHAWEHEAYILDGHGTLLCGGQEYQVSEGDGILVPGDTHYQWRNPSEHPVKRVTFNPLAAETEGG